MAEYRRAEAGWVPQQWVCTWLSGGQSTQVTKLAVTAAEFNPPVAADQFTVPLKPGMRVEKRRYIDPGKGLDPVLPATERYIVAPDGTLQKTGATGFTTLKGRQLPPDPGRP